MRERYLGVVQQWEDGSRRLDAEAHDRRRYESLLAQVEAITDELRRRVGQTFTLRELVDTYEQAERWTRDVVAERAPTPSWTRDVAMVEDAAFHRYARSASDYAR